MIPPPPGSQATTERHRALTPILETVFPWHLCDDQWAVKVLRLDQTREQVS